MKLTKVDIKQIIDYEIIISARLNELRNIKADKETMKALQIWSNRNKY